MNGPGTPQEPVDERRDGERPPPRRPSTPPPAGGVAPLWPTQQGGEAAMPVLGAPPPAVPQTPAPPAVETPRNRLAAPVGRPAEPAPAGTALTTRLSGAQADANAEDTAQREGGSTILLGSAGQSSAAQQAAAAARAVAVPAAQAAGVAASAPAAADSGTIYGGGNGPRGDLSAGMARRVRPLAALRIGSHLASSSALDEIRIASPGAGLLLGHDRDRKPVQVRLFRPEPTRATLVGGLWACRLMAFRALGLGARVVVFTGRPEQWDGFGQWATGRSDRVAVLPAERPVTVEAGPRVPALLIYDVGLLGAANRPSLGPWQTQLTVLHQLTAYGFPAVQESNLVVMQRLGAEEAVSAGSVLRLEPDATRLLNALRDDMFALVGGGADRYVWVDPTGVELQRIGAPRR